ncbi:hypothetical protein GGX14DRAFT_569640 [Mycena pura]|uniref:Uncharacterized protein n=1 Tax=Mycena pura TaxID=153505 RepID=A0AAD6V6L7_9AGAR|nr:hypothetical protein GGX14DRAFT_569640 [Mycena pura]
MEAIQHMRPTKLSFNSSSDQFPGSLLTFDHPLFTNVTHLDIALHLRFEDLECAWAKWRPLTSLPKLTHLALSSQLAHEILPQLLTECPGLTLFMIRFWVLAEAVEFTQTLSVADPRVVVVHALANFLMDWKGGAYGDDDFWARGDQFVLRKRTGEILSTQYLLDETEV